MKKVTNIIIWKYSKSQKGELHRVITGSFLAAGMPLHN